MTNFPKALMILGKKCNMIIKMMKKATSKNILGSREREGKNPEAMLRNEAAIPARLRAKISYTIDNEISLAGW